MADRKVDRPYRGGYGPAIVLTGTTTDSYVTILDYDGRQYMSTSIILQNTHTSNGLKFKVSYRETDYDNGAWIADSRETTLPAGEWAVFKFDQVWGLDFQGVARIKVEVKAASAGNQATYQLKYRSVNKE